MDYLSNQPIYLDYNATTPLDNEVMKAMLPYLEFHYGNPSSSYLQGIIARQAMEEARQEIATALNCLKDEVYFTSGGTESNNIALKGFAFANRKNGNHIITSTIEHPAILEVCRYLACHGFDITYCPVSKSGMIDIEYLEKSIHSRTILISIMHANNEVGTIQPLETIAAIAKQNDIAFHSDAAQSFGKIPVDISAIGLDMLSLAGHKFYAPKGIGVLYLKKGIYLEKQMHGGGQEKNLRSGTENIPYIVAIGKAASLVHRDLNKNIQHFNFLKEKLHKGIQIGIKGVQTNGDENNQLPNTLSLSFKGLNATDILNKVAPYLSISAGAACHSEEAVISHVLTAMQVPMEYAKGTLRLSVGKMTTAEESNQAVEILLNAIKELQQEKGL